MERRKNKAVSGLIATVIMIGIVLAVVGVVWVSVNNLISDQIKTSTSCYGNFGKVALDRRYTCYDQNSNEFEFSIKVGDIVIESILVSISSKSGSKSLEISNKSITGVKMYNGSDGEIIVLPGENAGFTYVVNITEFGIGVPEAVTIAPIINGIQCETSDSILEIDNCSFI